MATEIELSIHRYELPTIKEETNDEIFRCNYDEFMLCETFINRKPLNEWLKEFPNVKFDLVQWMFGNGTVYVKGSSADLERMAKDPELLVEFHESIINTFDTINIEYVTVN